MSQMKDRGRISLCGYISMYNADTKRIPHGKSKFWWKFWQNSSLTLIHLCIFIYIDYWRHSFLMNISLQPRVQLFRVKAIVVCQYSWKLCIWVLATYYWTEKNN